MDTCIDGELHLGPGAGPGVVGHADGASFLVFDDGLASLGAAQDGIHAGFHAGDAFFIADVVVETAGIGLGHVAFFPLFEIAQHMAGERAVGVFALRPHAQIDAWEVEVVFGEAGELVIAEVRAIAEWHQPAVREEMGSQGGGIVVAGEIELAQAGDGPLVDDFNDVHFRALAGHAALFGEPVDGGGIDMLAKVGLADFLEVEGNLVFPQVAGQHDAVAVGDLAADAGFAHGHGAVAGDLAHEFIAALDLEFIEAVEQ